MKKTYMIPTLQVVKIQTANLLQAISGEFGVGTQPGGSAATREAMFSDFDEADFDTSLPNTFQFDME